MQDAQDLAPEAARAEIENLPLNGELMAALQDPAHAGHKAANTHRRALYAAAYPAAAEKDADEGTGRAPAEDTGHEGGHFAVPEAPEAYRFDTTPAALQHDPELEQRARSWFHKAGAPQWLARNLVNEWNRAAADQSTPNRDVDRAPATEEKLRKLWGDAFESKVAKANAVLATIGDDDVFRLLDQSGLANSEYLIRQLAALAEHRQTD